jgi:hypothetical protein
MAWYHAIFSKNREWLSVQVIFAMTMLNLLRISHMLPETAG